MNRSRRVFLTHTALVGGALVGGARVVDAAPVPKRPVLLAVSEADAQAAALGFKLDTAKVDKVKFPKHVVAQQCANCVLYQGKAGTKTGPCAIFVGKSVPAAGWCSAWAKKP